MNEDDEEEKKEIDFEGDSIVVGSSNSRLQLRSGVNSQMGTDALKEEMAKKLTPDMIRIILGDDSPLKIAGSFVKIPS